MVVLPSLWNEVVMSVLLEPDSLELKPSLTPVHNPPVSQARWGFFVLSSQGCSKRQSRGDGSFHVSTSLGYTVPTHLVKYYSG